MFDTPPASIVGISAATSDGEQHSHSAAGDLLHADARTASLGALIDHTSKLLGRIQSADIVTLEKRLKKQNLPGDVRHLAQANLKDLVSLIPFQIQFEGILNQLDPESGDGH